ncbi:hypothetical protein Tco_0696920 [Tanacetum coccineum]
MGDEHLNTIPSVENLVPIPSESEGLSDNESECDVLVNDESSPTFTTFSNPHFDSNNDFTSSDDESLTNEDVPIENFKIYSNPLFDNEEIISTKIEPHYFNAESDLIESLLNRDISTIDLFLAFDDSMPPGIENDDYDLEGDIRFLEELLSNDSPLLTENESSNLDHFNDPSSPRPPPEPPDVEICFDFEPDTAVKNDFDKLNDDDCFDPGGGEIVVSQNVEDDDSFTFVIWTFIPFLTYPTDSPLLLSTGSEDTIFDPGIST